VRYRNNMVRVRLSDTEYSQFQKRVGKSGLSMEAYLRKLINGQRPKDLPPPDYHRMMSELYGIGAALREIAAEAHFQGRIDEDRFEQCVVEYKDIVRRITDTVTEPDKIE